ncbi:MAG: DEAD/DEAH box helicase family protein [Alicyclobacillaceae bacterium]|nr:DEAD/DEAH box helicase family protein [Alicyclobacillaceae bacterium]
MDLVVIDVETTGVSPESCEIIEIAAVHVSDGQIERTFQSLIRPRGHVPPEILDMTQIQPGDLAAAPDVEDVLPAFLDWTRGLVWAGHRVDFDLAFLQAACRRAGYSLAGSTDAVDTWRLSRVLYPTVRDHGLDDVAARCGVVPERPRHRALPDALTTVRLLAALKERALQLPYVTLQELEALSSTWSPATACWWMEVADARLTGIGTALPPGRQAVDGLVFVAVGSRGEGAPSAYEDDGERGRANEDGQQAPSSQLVTASSRLLDRDSPLTDALPGFQVRPGQRRMVEAVAAAMERERHLVVEAGTGTGKSLAYLIPSALYALERGSRVVVSTYTTSLQDQIAERDFPTLRQVVKEPLTLAVLKGRNRYVCMRKLRHETRQVGMGTAADEAEAYMALVVWLVDSPAGCREEIGLGRRISEVWPRVQSETETCVGKRCPFFKPCHYFRARAQAHSADVLVTNHSLIMSDIKSDFRILPRHDVLVVDEAHHLEREAARHLGEEVHQAHCLALAARLVRDSGRHGVLPELTQQLASSGRAGAAALMARLTEQVGRLRTLAEDAFAALAQLFPRGELVYRLHARQEPEPAWQRFVDTAQRLEEQLPEWRRELQELAELAADDPDAELAARLLDAHGFGRELAARLAVLSRTAGPDAAVVQWIELVGSRERKYVIVHRTPLNVSDQLRESLFAAKRCVVLTSATLAVNGDFTYVKQAVGLDALDAAGRVESLAVESPFQLDRQALLCVPSDVPDLSRMGPDEAAAWLSESLRELAGLSDGRLLALFTSHGWLQATARRLRGPLRQAGYALFAQGIDGERTRIVEAFRRQPRSVLLGAQSFWEGIDLPGDQLRTLVIVRLPFTPPNHPVAQARDEQIARAGRSAFWTASLPEAVVRFKQGFGRLIRTVDDRGVVVVYDKRIATSRYGSRFVQAVGVRPLVAPEREVFRRIERFFAEGTAHSR